MKVFKRSVCVLLIFSFSSLVSGCASYRFGRLPSPYIVDQPNATTQENVSVAVKFLNPTEALATFDCEMDKRNISPVFVVIENKSNNTYGFRKVDVDSSYLPCEESAKKCSRSTMGRVASYGLLGVFIISAIVFIPMAIGEAINCPRINAQMKSDYCTNEIADATIGPGRSLSGVMYVAPFKSGEAFNISLINKETGAKLVFQFQNTQIGSVGTQAQEVKKEKEADNKTPASQPTQNFGPR